MKILKVALTFFLAVVIAVVAFNYGYDSAEDNLSNKTAPLNFDNAVFDALQEYRLNNNLSSYTKSNELCYIAAERSYEVQTDWTHNQFMGNTKKYFQLLPKFQELGENLSYDLNEPKLLVDAWFASPKHKENMDKPFSHLCVRSANGYTVAIFGAY